MNSMLPGTALDFKYSCRDDSSVTDWSSCNVVSSKCHCYIISSYMMNLHRVTIGATARKQRLPKLVTIYGYAVRG